ncbi:MAG TPA: MFS transporter [Acidimicrobiales bacterium]|nr:MFS transporter [Acidimicrobiales bacterium]
MSTIAALPTAVSARGWRNAIGRRQLDRYPVDGKRYVYLGIVVLTTIILYYLYYVEGAITPLMLPYYHMSFLYFLYLLVVSNAIGAFTAFIGGLSDKIGRANLTIYGTLTVGLIQLVGVPHIHTKFAFAVAYCVIGFVEGIILVSTPALIRDFSPQMGRASAMGFWALGPTVGSLLASVVATRTLHHLQPWQDQFIISGFACLAVVFVAFFGLRELSPQLRDQLMVSENERALVEARARGLDVDKATRHPLRSMLRLDLLSSSFAISAFLLIYYASVSVLTLYWVVIFNRTTADANGINTWYWGFDAVFLILVGALSDRLRVRKPFMVVGGTAAIIMTMLMIEQVNHPHTGYYANVLVAVLLGIAIACTYTPWMASYTEQVEAHNPALAATGLAVWGWVLRIVVAASFVVLPMVITTSTTLVDNQGAATNLQTFQAAQPYLPTAANPHPGSAPASVVSSLEHMTPAGPGQALGQLLQAYGRSHNIVAGFANVKDKAQLQGLLTFAPLAADIQAGRHVSSAQIAGVGSNSPQLATLLRAEVKVVPAQKASPSEWRRWWWVCAAGQLVFLGLVFRMRGRWSPRAARRDFQEHERLVGLELARLHEEMERVSVGAGPEPVVALGRQAPAVAHGAAASAADVPAAVAVAPPPTDLWAQPPRPTRPRLSPVGPRPTEERQSPDWAQKHPA